MDHDYLRAAEQVDVELKIESVISLETFFCIGTRQRLQK